MRRVLTSLIVLVVGSLCILWLLLCGPAPAGPPAAHAAVLASVEATACPAPERVVRLALRQYRAAGRAYDTWQRARRCLSLDSGRLRVERRPDRDATAWVWLAAMDKWQRQAADFRARSGRLVARMKHPGGTSCGARWRPLMRWLRYPESIIPTFVYIIQRESSGRVRAVNPYSGCSGLLQFMPQWFRGQWGYPAFDPFDPLENLKAGLWLWKRQGWSPWAL